VSLLLLGGLLAVVLHDRPHWHRWCALWVALAVPTVIHTSAFAVLGRCVGLIAERVSFFFGGALVRLRVRDTWWSVGWAPLGGSAKFAGKEPARVGRAWSSLAWPVRATLPLAGPSATSLAAVALIGPAHCVAIVAGLPGHIAACFTPAHGDAARAFIHLLDDGGLPAVAGAACVVQSVVNLIPTPFFNGGQFLVAILERVTGRQLPAAGLVYVASVSGMLCLFVAVVFAAAVARAWPAIS
jgi:membrane-associated protease RseP (regulator of RpoE activity)